MSLKDCKNLEERLIALARLEILNDPSNLTAVLTHICEIVEKLLPTTGGASILLWDADKQQFYVSASTVPGQQPNQVTHRIRRKGGATRWIIDNRQPVIVSDIKYDPFGANPMLGEFGLKAYAGFPIIARGEAIGVLYALDREPRTYTEQDQVFLKVLSERAASALLNARLFAELETLATHDDLTGVYNRRGFLLQAEREFQRAQRFDRPLSLLMIDVDHFKRINDAFGHAIGDRVLVEIASRLKSKCREMDILGRIGGDEFAVLLVEMNAEGALEVAERLRKEVANSPIRIEGVAIEAPISVGVASISARAGDMGDFLRFVDRALYDAKEQGRNRIRLFGESSSGLP